MCSVNSSHNIQVVNSIVDTIGTEDYAEELIRSNAYLYACRMCNVRKFICTIEGCKTYMKTLAERLKHLSTPVKRQKQIRSRKQRVRSCFRVLCLHTFVHMYTYTVKLTLTLSPTHVHTYSRFLPHTHTMHTYFLILSLHLHVYTLILFYTHKLALILP